MKVVTTDPDLSQSNFAKWSLITDSKESHKDIAINNIKIYPIMLSELELTLIVVTILQQASKHQMFSENSIPHACLLVMKDANAYLDNE